MSEIRGEHNELSPEQTILVDFARALLGSSGVVIDTRNEKRPLTGREKYRMIARLILSRQERREDRERYRQGGYYVSPLERVVKESITTEVPLIQGPHNWYVNKSNGTYLLHRIVRNVEGSATTEEERLSIYTGRAAGNRGNYEGYEFRTTADYNLLRPIVADDGSTDFAKIAELQAILSAAANGPVTNSSA